MGQVVQIVSPCTVDEAWEAYRAHAAQAIDNPALAIDRQHMEKLTRLHRRWTHLFFVSDKA